MWTPPSAAQRSAVQCQCRGRYFHTSFLPAPHLPLFSPPLRPVSDYEEAFSAAPPPPGMPPAHVEIFAAAAGDGQRLLQAAMAVDPRYPEKGALSNPYLIPI